MKKENKYKLVLDELKQLIEKNTILKNCEIYVDRFYKNPKYVLFTLNNIMYNIQVKRNKLIVNRFGFSRISLNVCAVLD